MSEILIQIVVAATIVGLCFLLLLAARKRKEEAEKDRVAGENRLAEEALALMDEKTRNELLELERIENQKKISN